MKKNLKKLISAVISLAIAGSIIPASFAAKVNLTDVADTAAYATAVNTLVALNVINGYEDGTFLPDNLITRAEVTKVVVAALNMLESAEGMSGSTQFTDMDESSAWANGFVNAGVSKGFINGMGDGTFAPKANVTYAQIVKMLVSSLGYDEYAKFLGGYPNGYLQVANSEGITDGVKAGINDNVTRAQVAQLVYNFMQTPIVDNTGMTWSTTGQLLPTIEKMDGTDDKAYRTILTDYFDAYMVEGYVVETSKSTNSSLDVDEVVFGIAKSQAYDNDDFVISKNVNSFDDAKKNPVTVNVGDTDAANFYGVYATAIIMVDEYDDKVIISFTPSGKNKSVSFDATLIDESKYNDEDKPANLYFYANADASKSTKYVMENGFELYVNGFKVDVDKTNINKYLINNDTGVVELVDTHKTNGEYDKIYVTYYGTAKVSAVYASDDEIAFSKYTNTDDQSEIVLDTEANENLVYTIYLNGEEITLAEINKDDILSIAYDPNGFEDSDYYEIYVSRDVVSGQVTGRDSEDETVTIAGTKYQFVNGYQTLTMGDEYTAYLDYFGRIYTTQLDTQNANYGIIDRLTDSNANGWTLKVYTSEGAVKNYVIDTSSDITVPDVDPFKTILTGISDINADKDTRVDVISKLAYSSFSDSVAKDVKRDVTTRVIKYKVSSAGKIRAIEFLEAADGVDSEYKTSGKIGSVKIGTATKIVDAVAYTKDGYEDSSDLKLGSVTMFDAGVIYTAYGFGNTSLTTDRSHPFVVVTKGESAYNANTLRFAVALGSASEEMNGDDLVYTIPAMYKGEKESKITIAEECKGDYDSVAKGDVFVFLTDSNGYAEQLDIIFDASAAKLTDYTSFINNVIKDNGDIFTAYKDFLTIPAELKSNSNWNASWSMSNSKNEPIQIVMGPIVGPETVGSSIQIAKIQAADYTVDEKVVTSLYTNLGGNDEDDEDGVYDITVTDNTAVYNYDYSESDKDTNRFKATKGSSVKPMLFDDNVTLDDGEVAPWDSNIVDEKETNRNRTKANIALALVIDGVAVDVYQFIAD